MLINIFNTSNIWLLWKRLSAPVAALFLVSPLQRYDFFLKFYPLVNTFNTKKMCDFHKPHIRKKTKNKTSKQQSLMRYENRTQSIPNLIPTLSAMSSATAST